MRDKEELNQTTRNTLYGQHVISSVSKLLLMLYM